MASVLDGEQHPDVDHSIKEALPMTKPLISALVGALALAGTVAGAALAQDGRTLRSPPRPEATQPAPPDENAPQPEGSTVPPGEDLSHSGGVLTPPPSADRGVVKPPSEGTGSMPVIPPPGTPGGNPSVKPK